MKKWILMLLLVFGFATVGIAMDGGQRDNEQQTQQTWDEPEQDVIDEEEEDEGMSLELWALILTGCITPIAIAFINRKKKE